MADLVMKRLRRPHPDWGNGSLMTVTAGMAQTHEPFLSDPDFADALLRLLQHQNNRLAEHRKKKNGPSGWKNWRKRYMISQEIKYEAKDGTDTTPSCKRRSRMEPDLCRGL
jgi:hypothetical protein